MANRAAGKGYENEDNYDNIRFKFIGIENIHVMRSSLQKLLEGACRPCEWPLFLTAGAENVNFLYVPNKKAGEILHCTVLL